MMELELKHLMERSDHMNELLARLVEVQKEESEIINELHALTGSGFINGSIDSLNLSARARNCLTRAGIKTVADLINCPKRRLSKTKWLGETVANEIVQKMHEIGFTDFSIIVLKNK